MNNSRRKKTARNCEWCEAEYYPWNNRQRFCSRECGRASRPRKERIRTAEGYILRLAPDHPATQSGGYYVFEHRLVAEAVLGRYLKPYETIHHKNGRRDDNRPENLELRVGNHGVGATEAHCHTCTCFQDNKLD